jgi:hypothetical protein
MLAEGTRECPRCGKKLAASDEVEEFGATEILRLSFYALKYLLLPVLLVVLVTAGCYFVFFAR